MLDYDMLVNQISLLTKAVTDLTLLSAKPISSFSFYQFFDMWIDTYKKPFVKPYSLRSILTVFRIYIKPYFLDINISSITGVLVQNLLNRLPDTRQKESVYFIFSDCLGIAYKNGFISSNIMASVRPYKHVRKEGRAMTLLEQNEFISKIKNTSCEKFFLFVLFTGCRRGEALSLFYEDIDIKNNTILIRGTKTKDSFRLIPLFDNVKKILMPQVYRKGKVFFFTPDYVSKCIKKLGLSFDLCIKDLRTTFSTRCDEFGISDNVISAWLGHSSVVTTKKFYIKVLSEHEQNEAKKLNFIFN